MCPQLICISNFLPWSDTLQLYEDGQQIPGSGMSNIAFQLILPSLGSRYLEAECLTSLFSLFCLPWVADTWKRNVKHRFLAYSSSLSSIYLEAECITSRFGLFCRCSNQKRSSDNKQLKIHDVLCHLALALACSVWCWKKEDNTLKN